MKIQQTKEKDEEKSSIKPIGFIIPETYETEDDDE